MQLAYSAEPKTEIDFVGNLKYVTILKNSSKRSSHYKMYLHGSGCTKLSTSVLDHSSFANQKDLFRKTRNLRIDRIRITVENQKKNQKLQTRPASNSKLTDQNKLQLISVLSLFLKTGPCCLMSASVASADSA